LNWKAALGLAIALAALLSGTSLTALAAAQSGTWSVTLSPNQGARANQLNGIAAASSSAIWSVGSYNAGPYTNSLRTLIESWNGTAWSIVASPNPATKTGDYDSLQGVVAVSPSNVWAVGYSGNVSAAADKAVIEHWNGTTWTIAASPNPYTTQDLYGVAASSASDVWTVGQYTNYSPSYRYGGLIEHWNGKVWSNVANPSTTGLYGVAALASNNAWAAGGAQILHWDGTAWSIVPSPQPGNPSNGYFLRAVSAVSANDVWAVGYTEIASGEGYTYGPLIEHWDGSTWTVSPSAIDFHSPITFYGVTALSATSVWVVGGAGGLSLVEKWNGTQWTVVASPNVGSSNNTFQSVTAIPTTGDVWAAGEFFNTTTSVFQTLVERCQAC
jgi:hypothetical protein